jgi:quercetin dioxygenase-like cupin family protein
MIITVGDDEHRLGPGEAIHIPPGHWHELRADGDGLTVLVHADGTHDPSDAVPATHRGAGP